MNLHHARLLLCLLVALPTAANSQSGPIGFEKEVRTDPPFLQRTAPAGLSEFDVLHYELDLHALLVTDALWGTNTITLVLLQSLDSLTLHGVGLRLDTVRVNGTPATTRIDTAAETVTIGLGSTHLAGDTLRIRIAYERLQGYPRPSSRRGYYHFLDTLGLPAHLGYTMSEPSDARFWMPCYDEPWDKATAQISVTVPDGYVAASNGRFLGSTANGNGMTTWRWREDHQIATYLMCFTASWYAVSTLQYVTAGGDTIPLQYFTWQPDSAECAAYLPTVASMMQALEGRFGPYPFDKYGMATVIPFPYLGMEHQTITTINRFARTRERVVLHELAHQWWGDLVTCGTWADIWLNESFATYSEALWAEHLGGAQALRRYMKDSLEHFFFASWQGAIHNPVGQGFNLFDDLVYSKGAWVLHTLRGVVGDSMFFRVLRAYRERHAGHSPSTSELAALVDSVTGSDMSWFFDQWVYGRGWPRYSYEFTAEADTIVVHIGQFQNPLWPTYTMPIQLRFRYSDRPDTTIVVTNTQRIQTYRFPRIGELAGIDFDPEDWILKEVYPWPLSVDEQETPGSFTLFQNYPNPFNPRTSIQFSLPSSSNSSATWGVGPSTGTAVQVGEGSHVTLKVYDVLGRQIAVLVDDVRGPGTHYVQFDASQSDGKALSSGIYFYRLATAKGVKVMKMILLR